MKNFVFIGLAIIMFFFKSSVAANYEKTIFDLKIEGITGEIIDLSQYKNKVILVVNTASYCGFTKQYSELQELWDLYKSKGLVIIGVPSNSFNQEKNSESEVKDFCEVNFNITFPLTSISKVKGENANELYKWAKNNHGNSAVPKWNFHKILVNKEGKIEDTFASFTRPLSNKIIKKLDQIL